MRYLPRTYVLLFMLCISHAVQADYHPPKLYSYISSHVEIGVERKGMIETVITHDRSYVNKEEVNKKHSVTETITDEINSKKEKKTNPDKHKSRPKASGLFGGIVRAFAGDPSGLLDWGGKFVDHMMEPQYLWNVARVSHQQQEKTSV